jgi:hypothetical protein
VSLGVSVLDAGQSAEGEGPRASKGIGSDEGRT